MIALQEYPLKFPNFYHFIIMRSKTTVNLFSILLFFLFYLHLMFFSYAVFYFIEIIGNLARNHYDWSLNKDGMYNS